MGVSTLLHWLAGSGFAVLWILPDEGVYAQRALTIWHGGLLQGGAGYSLLYPLVAGIPLALGNALTGFAALKAVQALLVSLVALPLYLYGRRVMPRPYALVAATLALASPLLLYSGLVMTEVLYYPVAAWALLAGARAVETGRLRHQGIALALVVLAVLTRTQAIVLVPVLVLALLLDAALARDPRRALRAPLFWAVAALGAAAALLRPALLGAYATTLQGGYPLGRSLALAGEHLAWLVVSTGVLPAVAALLLAGRAYRGGLDGGARAVVAVTIAAVVLVCGQVGMFAARFAPHLLDRDLAALPPVLFVCLALLLSRGPARDWTVVAIVTGLVLGGVAATPWQHLVTGVALPDTLGLAGLYRLGAGAAPAVVAGFTLAALVLLALVPPRLRLLQAAFVLATLVTASAFAAQHLRSELAFEQTNLAGPSPTWIDEAATGPVAYLYDGERYWNGVWQTAFWNRRIDDVLALAPGRVPGPLAQRSVLLPPDGRLPTADRFVVASDPHRFSGTPVAHLAQQTIEQSGLTLWRLAGPPRLSEVLRGVQVNGDMTEPATDTVYDCAGGQLQLTLLPKSTQVVTVLLDGRAVLRERIAGLPY